MLAEQHFDRFFFLFFAGLGLVLAGGLNLALRRSRTWVRVTATVLAGGAALGGQAAFLDSTRLLPAAAAVLAGGLVPAVVFADPRVNRFVVRLVERTRDASVRWGLLAAAGFALLVVSAVQFEVEDEAVLAADMAVLEVEAYKPEGAPPVSVRAVTDRGTEVHVRQTTVPRDPSTMDPIEEKTLRDQNLLGSVIRRQPADDRSNCHGWVFTGGQFWVTGEEVEAILSENGYREVPTPKPGDLVIYRSQNGSPSHTAVVRYVGDGLPVMVEGKWGWMGVFLHPVDKSSYGTRYQFYSSPRRGHLLAGVPNLGPGVPVE